MATASAKVTEVTQRLPLLVSTPRAWAESVLENPIALLCDHAHLERKAASNALALIQSWPEAHPCKTWVQVLAGVARDEAEHLALVVKILHSRGELLSRGHRNPYAKALNDLVRRGTGPNELLDRLLISALIEARSCERFALLGEEVADIQLAKLYRGLWASEHGHFKVFLELGREILPREPVEARWQEVLHAEADIVQSQRPGPRMHSWV